MMAVITPEKNISLAKVERDLPSQILDNTLNVSAF